MRHAVLLGDPAFFRIKSGKNPYTRTRWGFRKKVDLGKAVAQWGKFKETLETLGAKVFVFPPQKDNPSTVFPANAGFLFPKYERSVWSKKRFYLSNLSPHRRQEAPLYAEFLASLGLTVETMPYAFEGEADFFPAESIIFSRTATLCLRASGLVRGGPRTVTVFRTVPTAGTGRRSKES